MSHYKIDIRFGGNINEAKDFKNADQDTICKEFFFNAVTGKVDIDKEWDNYVSKWMKAGGDKLTEEMNKAVRIKDLLK